MKTSAEFATDLEALRTGQLAFDAFARTHRERFARWAGYFFERWPQRGLDHADLVQEALLEAWRAVDAYDEDRGVSIDRFVEYRVGSRLRTELQRVLGWPKKSRGTKAVRPVSLMGEVATRYEAEPGSELSPYHREVTRQIVERIEDGLTREVVAGVTLGLPVAAVASHLYDDPDRRIRYRFDSLDHAVRVVRRAVRQAAKHPAIVSSREDTQAGR